MTKRMLIDAVHPEETRMVIAEHSKIVDFDFITSSKKQIKGNIYLAKITRVEPSLQAAFVEYGGGKQGFLPFAEIHADYYQIPVSDRKRLIEEQEAMLREQEEQEEAEEARRESRRFRRGRGRGRDRNRDEAVAGEESLPDALDQLGVPGGNEPQPPADPWEAEMQATAQPLEFKARLENEPSPDALLKDLVEDFSDKDVHHAETPANEIPAVLPSSAAESTEMVTRSEPVDPGFGPEEFLPQPANDDVPADAEATGENSEGGEAAETVETLGNEEEQVREVKKRSFIRRYKIQEVIKRNQIVLVQVIKEERGNKGVSLTTYISLAGRYCVLMPNSPKGGGISRKISSGEDRRRLKQIATELEVTPGMSAIIRTAGLDRTRAEINRDFEYLTKLWDTIRERTLESTAPALIFEESDIIKRSIRDLYTPDIEEIVIEGEEAYQSAKEFMKVMMPSHAPRVHEHKGNVPIFHEYNVEEQLIAMHEPTVRLRSGGYIVIAPTEALTAIDVNSGRYTGERNIEETATKINIEAAYEVARQVRLRDFGGLLVIDFIDMVDLRNRKAVERALKDALRHDRAKIQIGRISAFGLLEMSRQRLRPSISETSTIACPHCLGKGVVRSHESLSIQIVRALEKEASTGQFGELKLNVRNDFALFLMNSKRDAISRLEKEYEIRVVVVTDEDLAAGSFRIEKIKNRNPQERSRRQRFEENSGPAITAADIEMPEMSEEPETENMPESSDSEESGGNAEFPSEGQGRRPRRERGGRRGRRGGRGRRDYQDEATAPAYEGLPVDEGALAGEPALEGEAAPANAVQEGEGSFDDRPRGRRRWKNERGERGGRNRRGGRGRREGYNRQENDASAPVYEGLPADESSFADLPPPRPSRPEPVTTSSASRPAAPMLLPGQTLAEPYTPRRSAEEDDGKPKRKGWWKRLVE